MKIKVRTLEQRLFVLELDDDATVEYLISTAHFKNMFNVYNKFIFNLDSKLIAN